MRWQLQEAKSKFSQVVNQALSEGPQVVTKHGRDSVVILSIATYQQLVTSQPTLLELLNSAPFAGSGLEIQRNRHDFGRDFTL